MQSGSARASRPDSLSPDENPAAMNVWTKLAPVGPASTRLRRTLFSAVQGSASCAAAGRAASSAKAVNKARLDRLMELLLCSPVVSTRGGEECFPPRGPALRSPHSPDPSLPEGERGT